MAENKEFSTYKGKPLVRCGDELYYGNMDEEFVIHLIIKSKTRLNVIRTYEALTTIFKFDMAPKSILVID